MLTRHLRSALAATLAAMAILASGCSPQSTVAEGAAEAPTIYQPPSTPVAEATLRDPTTGTTVTALAIVPDFTDAEAPAEGIKTVLVKVRVTASSTFRTEAAASFLFITARDQHRYLGVTNPDPVKESMKDAGYTLVTNLEPGETATGWIGAWQWSKTTQFDLVYNRAAGKIYGTNRIAPAARDVAQLIPT